MITSRHNERLKDIRRLRQCKDGRGADPRHVQGVLEGPHLIEEALACGRTLSSLLMTPDFADGEAGRRLLPRLPMRPIAVAPQLLDELADSDSPRGIVAVVDLPRIPVQSLSLEDHGVYVFAEGLQDPGNVGALARTAEASGAQALILGPGCAHRQHPRALRASAGSLLRLAACRASLSDLQSHLRTLSPRYVALVPRGGTDLYQAELCGAPLVVLLGSEGRGLSETARRRADLPLTIPVAPPVESLNATVAASLVLFEIRRQRRTG